MPDVPGYTVAKNGFRFANDFPDVPMQVMVCGHPISFFTAGNGLCGGITFLGRDYFEAGLPAPDMVPAPSAGPVFQALCARQLASFDIPVGFLRYLDWMCPARPWRDCGTVQGRWERTVHEEWPRVKADIDSGHPSPLGLVHVLSWDPRDVGKCHQVLAWGYDVVGSRLTLKVCDPNHPQDAGVCLGVDLAEGASIAWNGSSAPVHGFFRSEYRAALPPKKA
jgi:hypothetical protein